MYTLTVWYRTLYFVIVITLSYGLREKGSSDREVPTYKLPTPQLIISVIPTDNLLKCVQQFFSSNTVKVAVLGECHLKISYN